MKKQERAGHSFLASSSDEGGADFQQEEIFFKCPPCLSRFYNKRKRGKTAGLGHANCQNCVMAESAEKR